MSCSYAAKKAGVKNIIMFLEEVHHHLKDLITELQQTNLEKKTLLTWCRQNSQKYPSVDIKNFTTSWSNGLAFNAILHKWKFHLFDFNNIARKYSNARLDHAFRLAQEQDIKRLLDLKDVNTLVLDKKFIIMYVTCLFQSLLHSGDDIGEQDLLIASDSTSISPVDSVLRKFSQTHKCDQFSTLMLIVHTFCFVSLIAHGLWNINVGKWSLLWKFPKNRLDYRGYRIYIQNFVF